MKNRKRKNIIHFILCFVLLFCGMCFIGKPKMAEAADTYDLTVGDFQCNYNEDGTLTIMEYTGRAENLTIPNILGDKKVTAIGTRAFSILSPKSITLSSGITRIEKEGFASAWTTRNITIPESVTFIGEGAFSNSGIESITLPGGITNLSRGLFSGCGNLTSVTLKGNVESIGESAFYASGIQSIVLPDSVIEIGMDAFRNCKNLKEVTLSKNLTLIKQCAFMNSGIESIVLPEGVKEASYGLFDDCEALTRVTLPESLESIGSNAFRNTGLKRLEIGKNVVSIDSYTGGNWLSSITSFLQTDIYIEVSSENNFFSSRDGALYNKEQTMLLAYPSAKGDIAISNTVTKIGGFSMAYTKVDSIIIPDSVKEIGIDAFQESSLSSVALGNGLTEIGVGAFFKCNLASIFIPESVKNIYNGVFSGNADLHIEVAKENEMYASEEGLLYDKAKETLLEAPSVHGEYTIKNGVKRISDYAFFCNDFITEVYTGDTVQEISSYAFYNCKNLKRLILGDSVTTLNYDMVYLCRRPFCVEGGKNAFTINCGSYGETPFDMDFSEKAMIIGEEDSGIVQFAIANNLPYMISRKLGDVNCDGNITSVDALAVLRYVVGIEEKYFYAGAADCDGEKGITEKDALAILKYEAGILKELFDKEKAGVYVKPVGKAKAGEQVTIEVVANKDMYWSAFQLYLYVKPEKINVEKEAIQIIPENYDSISGNWKIWKVSSYKGYAAEVWNDAEYYYCKSGANNDISSSLIRKNTVILSLTVEVKEDLMEGDIIATFKLPDGYTDDSKNLKEKKEIGLSVDCIVKNF